MTTFCFNMPARPGRKEVLSGSGRLYVGNALRLSLFSSTRTDRQNRSVFMAGCRRIDLGSMIKRGQEVCYFMTYKYIFSLPQCLQRSREYIWVNSPLSTLIFVCRSPKRWVSQNAISKKCWHSWLDFPFSKFSTILLMS